MDHVKVSHFRNIGRFLLITFLSALCVFSSRVDLPDGCQTSFDDEYRGTKVTCTGSGFNSSDIKRVVLSDATSLILSNNALYHLEMDIFKGVENLRSLSLSNCSLSLIKLHSFRGLNKLEVLNLKRNNLRFGNDYLPFHVFDDVPSLKMLALNGNKYSASNGTYSKYLNIFDSLSNLSSLFIDSFTDLYIGHEFSKLRMLHEIQITCVELEKVHYNSLEGLKNSTIKKLVLNSGTIITDFNFDVDVFKPLPDFMELLSIGSFHIGNNRTLQLMRGLQGKTIGSISLTHMNKNKDTETSSYESFIDSYIKAEETQYLSQVCVARFTFAYSRISGIEIGELVSGPWRNCIKYLDFSGNLIFVGGTVQLFLLIAFQNLEEITYSTADHGKPTTNFWNKSELSSCGYPETPKNNHLEIDRTLLHGKRVWINDESNILTTYQPQHMWSTSKPPSTKFDSKSLSSSSLIIGDRLKNDYLSNYPRKTSDPTSYESKVYSTIKRIIKSKTSLNFLSHPRNLLQNDAFNINHVEKRLKAIGGAGLSISMEILKLPKNLKMLRLDGLGNLAIGNDVVFKTPNSLQELYLRYCYRSVFLNGRLNGLVFLTHLDFTGSKLYMYTYIFDKLPNLKSLILKNSFDSPEFLQNNLHRIIRFNNNLELLDISQNGINSLPLETFKTNSKIRYLCLASNRFLHVPFDIRFTPDLEILDLRSNSIQSLSKDEMDMFDSHQKTVSNFTILLQGNAILCTCSTMKFIFWITSRGLVLFDNEANYSCSLENGVVTYTSKMTDIDVQFRRCEGKFYFMLSLILASVLMTLYLSIFLVSRYKTLIVSKILHVVVPGFIKVLSRKDFVYDVFVGYADDDVMYLKSELLRYLEEKWNLRTFIHHRDLRQDRLEMTKALRESWRCILLITANYLRGIEMEHHVMMTACLFVTPCNPKKVLVMVEKNVLHDIPEYVLNVVKEEDIIVLPSLEAPLSSSAVLALKQRLIQ